MSKAYQLRISEVFYYLTSTNQKPLGRGGSNNLDNLETLCERCHGKRHKKINQEKKAL